MTWYDFNYRNRKRIPINGTTNSIAGTIAVTNGLTAVVGTGTAFTQWAVGDQIQLPDTNWYTIATITTGLALTISVTYPGSTLSGQSYSMRVVNYQMKLTVYKSIGSDSAGVVYLGTKVNDDFSDIRFTKSDGTSLLDYWVESYVSGTSAVVWIEFDSIPASPSTTNFYIYYNYASATSASNGANTCIFFDDFDGDLSKWTGDTARGSLSGGELTLTSAGATCTLIASTTLTQPSAIRTSLQFYTYATTHGSGFGASSTAGGTQIIDLFIWSPNKKRRSYRNGTGTENNATDIDTSYHIWDLLWTADSYKTLIDGSTMTGTNPNTTNVPTANLVPNIVIAYGTANGTIKSKWFLTRKYTLNEPTWGTPGAEESPFRSHGFIIG